MSWVLKSDKDIRSSALRVIRYCLNSEKDVEIFVDLNLPQLVVRILDLNDQSAINDRCQALKIIRKILSISKKALPESFLISLISIINCSSKAEAMGSNPIRDKLYRPAIVIVCEIAFIEPLIVIHTGGFRALLGNVWNFKNLKCSKLYFHH